MKASSYVMSRMFLEHNGLVWKHINLSNFFIIFFHVFLFSPERIGPLIPKIGPGSRTLSPQFSSSGGPVKPSRNTRNLTLSRFSTLS